MEKPCGREGGWSAVRAVVVIVGSIRRGVLTVLRGGTIKVGAPDLGAGGGRWGGAPGWFSCQCRTADPGCPPPPLAWSRGGITTGDEGRTGGGKQGCNVVPQGSRKVDTNWDSDIDPQPVMLLKELGGWISEGELELFEGGQ